MIPERIHQYWHSEDIPESVATSRRLLQEHSPGYIVQLWSWGKAGDYIASHYGSAVAALFEHCAIPAMQSDFFRYCVLLQEGGIYLDSDAVLNVPFSRWLDREAVIALPMTNVQDRERPGLGNGLIACAADCQLLAFALGQSLFNIARHTSNNIAWITGPRTLHCALRYWRGEPAQLVDPRDCYIANFDLGDKDCAEHWSRRQQAESIFAGAEAPAAAASREALLSGLAAAGGLSQASLDAIDAGWRYADFEWHLQGAGDWRSVAAELGACAASFDLAALAPLDFDSHDCQVKQWRQDSVRRALAEFDRAVEELTLAMQQGAEPVDVRSGQPCLSPGLWWQAALGLEAAGQARLALDAIRRALDQLDYEWGIWLTAIKLHSAAGMDVETERLAGQVLAREPANRAALHYLALALERGGQLDRALANAEKLVAVANTENAWAQLARIQLKMDQPGLAGDTLVRARELFPGSRRFDRLLRRIN